MIYVVMGESWEYSDRSEWPVLAFRDEAAAQSHVKALDEWLMANKAHMDGEVVLNYGLKCPLDPDFSLYYTGTRYLVMPVQEAPENSSK